MRQGLEMALAWTSLIAGCLVGAAGALSIALGLSSLAHGGAIGVLLGAGLVFVGFFGGRYGYRIIYSQSG